MNYTMSGISKKVALPPKGRTPKKSALFSKMEKLSTNHSFIIEGAEDVKDVAPNVYATAKRLGIKVSLRKLNDGVGVWRITNPNPQTTLEFERENENKSSRRAA